MIDEIIKKTKQRMTLEEAYKLEKEILKILNDKSISKKDKAKPRSEGYLESVAIASDGYKYKNKLEHYKEI